MTVPVSNGQPDSFFVSEVRRSLRDQLAWSQESPAADGAAGAISSPASRPFHLQRAPVGRTVAFLSAPSAASGQTGFTSYTPLFDPAPPVLNPLTPPVLSDAGAGGTFPAGTYQAVYTLVVGGQEVGMSPISNSLSLAASDLIQVGALSGFNAAVTSIRVYLVNVPGATNCGLLGTIPVTSGATNATSFAGRAGTGILPALIVSDTGELFFPVAPQTGTISIQYQASRFGDQQVIDALYEGLDLLWPEVWTPSAFDTTSILPSPIQWEYALPVVYADPRTVVIDVESNPPSAFIIYTRISGWRFINDSVTPTIIFDRPPPVGGTVRITYAVPYTTLSQVPTIAQMLPVYYALARLMSDQEVMRSRADDQPALTAENAGAEKGGSLQTAAWWLQNMFEPNLRKLSLGYPIRKSIMNRAVQKLNLGPIWQGQP